MILSMLGFKAKLFLSYSAIMSDFVIHLPSNVQPNRFPSNCASNFTTQLDRPLDLDSCGEWEVALTEISYPKSVQIFSFREGISFTIDEQTEFCGVRSPCENTLDELIVSLNERSVDYSYRFKHKNGRVSLTIRDEKLQMTLDKSLADILGFYESEFAGMKMHLAQKPPTLHRNIDYVFIYSDIQEDVNVGHMTAPLLHALPFIKASDGDVVHHAIRSPIYRPIKTSQLSRINIRLCDGDGNDIPFSKGNSLAVLHVRRIF